MRKIAPSLVWFSALAGGAFAAKAVAAAGVPAESFRPLPVSAFEHAAQSLVYRNPEYGFSFSLPASWRGYGVLAYRWRGVDAGHHEEETGGPLLVIRHPLYTDNDPREDIPIMVFTKKQWGKDGSMLMVSPAGVGPAEIGRNRKYVFALPPRFAYDGRQGVDEVLAIVTARPLRAIPFSRQSTFKNTR
ncbi:MAG TPA: hypothetical protein VL967_15795 [Terracidiphilus sp.]|nr:hypothetical protein [Terracidiphilus sp.]